MNPDGPREIGPTDMDIDDGAVSCRHPRRCGSIKASSSASSDVRTPLYLDPRNYQFARSMVHNLPSPPHSDGLDDSPKSIVLTSSSSILPGFNPFVQELTSRKRKHSHDSPHMHITDHSHNPHEDAFANDRDTRPYKRIRPRLQIEQEREFSPLLIISPGRERDSAEDSEETISVFHYSQNTIDRSHTIQRYLHLENPTEYDPRILQSSCSPEVDSTQDPRERGRSDSAGSFAEVALASLATRKRGRLSTLQDLWLPRPFEETERPSLGSVKVHERGLEVPPSFFATSGCRMDGRWAPQESMDSLADTLGHPIHPPIAKHGGTINFFSRPLCDSPDSIGPDENWLPSPGPIHVVTTMRF